MLKNLCPPPPFPTSNVIWIIHCTEFYKFYCDLHSCKTSQHHHTQTPCYSVIKTTVHDCSWHLYGNHLKSIFSSFITYALQREDEYYNSLNCWFRSKAVVHFTKNIYHKRSQFRKLPILILFLSDVHLEFCQFLYFNPKNTFVVNFWCLEYIRKDWQYPVFYKFKQNWKFLIHQEVSIYKIWFCSVFAVFKFMLPTYSGNIQK